MSHYLLAPAIAILLLWVAHRGHLAYPYARKTWGPAWRQHVLPAVWPWMTLAEAGQAIPPAYTEYIGHQLIDHLRSAAA
ncbi:MAG TPA: hypothetical protein PKD84_13450 [Propionicimonas sp.]|nr:hypothetical protein [Propionicimonas sp.]